MKRNPPKCLICAHTQLVPYLNLGTQALANAFLKNKGNIANEQKYPLQAYYCTKCHLAQLGEIVDRTLLFTHYDFFSSASFPLEAYFREYAKKLEEQFPTHTKGFIVEIGSNDGILLKNFTKKGVRILGIDPAKNISKIANKNNIPTLPLFFNSKNAKAVEKKYGLADIIIANHVLAHTSDLHDIIGGITKLLSPNGIFVFEVQYLGDLLEKNLFDNTYHEHSTYLSLTPLITLLEQHNLYIFNVEKVEAQGGSLRVYANGTHNVFKKYPSIQKLITAEKNKGLHDAATYKAFGKKPAYIKKELVSLLKKIKKQKKTIAGYGASAKGSTLLQYCGIDNTLIDYVVDTTPSKQGKFTPGTHIPIYPPSYLETHTPDYVLILAWNYADIILKKEEKLRKNGVKFIIPIPGAKIV